LTHRNPAALTAAGGVARTGSIRSRLISSLRRTARPTNALATIVMATASAAGFNRIGYQSYGRDGVALLC